MRTGGSGVSVWSAEAGRPALHPSRSPVTGAGLHLTTSHSFGRTHKAHSPFSDDPAAGPSPAALVGFGSPQFAPAQSGGSDGGAPPTSSTHPVLGIRVPHRQRTASGALSGSGGSRSLARSGSTSEATVRESPSASDAAPSTLPPKKRFSTPPVPDTYKPCEHTPLVLEALVYNCKLVLSLHSSCASCLLELT